MALCGTLCGMLLPVALVFSVLFAYLICKELMPVKCVIVWCLIFYFGVLNTSLRIKETDELLSLAPIKSEIEATVLTIPQGKTEGKVKFFCKVDKIRFASVEKDFDNEKTLVTINQNPENPMNFDDLKLYGKYTFQGRLSTPFKAGNPSQFDYGNYLKNFNTYAVFYANNFSKINSSLTLKGKFMQRVNDYREDILKVHSKYLKSPNFEILGGIVFGDGAVAPPQNIKQSFINSGLLHILAASGMNVAFISGFFFIIMSLFKINYKLKIIIEMITVVIYSLMTGLGASVVRATLMLLFVLFGKLFDRDAHSVALLSFVALLMLIYNPMYINDVGFQLSFIVTLGLLLTVPHLEKSKNKIVNFLVSTLTIPVTAQLWVIPIQIFYFGNISLYAIFANIMSVPVLMLISFSGFVSSLISIIHPIADITCRIFDYPLNYMLTLLVNLSDFWGKLPHSTLQTTHPSVFQLILYYIMLSISIIFISQEFREKYSKVALKAFVIVLGVFLITLIPVKNRNLEVTIFDVGNADCFLIKSPSNDYMMIDTGKSGYKGGKSQAEIIVIKYLKANGINKLNNITITHFDNDHCGGASDLIKYLKVDKLYVNSLEHNSYTSKEIYKMANANKVSVYKIHGKEMIYNKDGLVITNLLLYKGKNDNDNSIITLLTYKDFSMLFTGDAGINEMEHTLSQLSKGITVLKVPHHGASGCLNKMIVDKINPKYAIISTGENKFGHPSELTIELLRNSKILRTDIDNSIRLIVNKKNKLKVLHYDIIKRKYVRVKY